MKRGKPAPPIEQAAPIVVDRFSFRPPKNGRAMRKDVAAAIGAEQLAGVKQLVDDVRCADVVYIICSREAWNELQRRAAEHSGDDLNRRFQRSGRQ